MNVEATLRRRYGYQWRVFDRRCRRLIETRFREGLPLGCPRCGMPLEATPNSLLGRCVVLDARGYDLNCRDCRRFISVVQHTPRSLRLLRMRRLLAAVRAARPPERIHRPRGGEAAAIA